ncbi:hypothetical protein, partial [Pelagicoccus sp. SDUM812005]|uniref:hypothetical protein n=1 Tax=Pelagicoccus sp. SDUM812005 TaxID=3041257 RepID=UPI00280EB51D
VDADGSWTSCPARVGYCQIMASIAQKAMEAFSVPEHGMSRRVRSENHGFNFAEESLKKSLIRESEKTLFGLLFLRNNISLQARR